MGESFGGLLATGVALKNQTLIQVIKPEARDPKPETHDLEP